MGNSSSSDTSRKTLLSRKDAGYNDKQVELNKCSDLYNHHLFINFDNNFRFDSSNLNYTVFIFNNLEDLYLIIITNIIRQDLNYTTYSAKVYKIICKDNNFLRFDTVNYNTFGINTSKEKIYIERT